MKKFIARSLIVLALLLACAPIVCAGGYRHARIVSFSAPVFYTPPVVFQQQFSLPVQGCCGGVSTQNIQSFRVEPLAATQTVRTERVETVQQPVQVQQQLVETRAVVSSASVGYVAPVLAVRERVRFVHPVRVAEVRINPVFRLGVKAVSVVVPRRFALQIGRRFSLRF